MELKLCYLSLNLTQTQYSPTAASDCRFVDGASNSDFDEVETADFADFAVDVEI